MNLWRLRTMAMAVAAVLVLVVVAAACSGKSNGGAFAGGGLHDGGGGAFGNGGGGSGGGSGFGNGGGSRQSPAGGGSDSGRGGGSASGGATGTTSFEQREQDENLQMYLDSLIGTSGTTQGAASGGPAEQFGMFLHDAELWGTVSVNQVGDHWELCGSAILPKCLTISDVTYATGGYVQSFKVNGEPLDEIVHYAQDAPLSQGDLAAVGFKGALVVPGAGRLLVVLSYGWDSDIDTATTGCDPSKATYSVDGGQVPVVGLSGGGGPDPSGTTSFFSFLVMIATFPTASLGGTVNVTCYANTGASNTFRISVPG